MNTPRKIKRYGQPIKNIQNMPPGGHYTAGLHNPKYAIALAGIASAFVHLENHMATLLGVLMGDSHDNVAGYIMRSIKSPRGRIDMMEDLLQLSHENRDLGAEFDEMIAEFGALNTLRNTYVHGLWWTANTPEQQPYLMEDTGHAMWFTASDMGDIDKMQDVEKRIWKLSSRVMLTCGPMLARRREAQANPQPSGAPKT